MEPTIMHMLRRSSARRAVLGYLVEHGSSYPSEIARRTGLDLPATLGALRGLGARYAKDLSLVACGLAAETCSPRGGIRVYEASAEGRSAWARFRGLRDDVPDASSLLARPMPRRALV